MNIRPINALETIAEENGYTLVNRLRIAGDPFTKYDVSFDKQLICKLYIENAKFKICSKQGHHWDVEELIDLHDPDSTAKFLKEVRKYWITAVKKSIWRFARVAMFWMSMLTIAIWAGIRLSNEGPSDNTGRVINNASSSYDLDASIKSFDRLISHLKIDYSKKTTTIFWVQSVADDVEVFKNEVFEWRTRFHEVVVVIDDMPTHESKREVAFLLKQYEQAKPHIPAGIGIYPYNREMFIMFILGVFSLGTSLYLNRHWLN